jgi:hypothetical protein
MSDETIQRFKERISNIMSRTDLEDEALYWHLKSNRLEKQLKQLETEVHLTSKTAIRNENMLGQELQQAQERIEELEYLEAAVQSSPYEDYFWKKVQEMKASEETK